MFNQLNTNLSDAVPADFSQESSRATPFGRGSGLGAQFAAELNRSVSSQDMVPEAAGTKLPVSGNALPLQRPMDFQQAIEADLAGVAPDVLQSIYSDLGELAEISGGSSLIVDDAIAAHDRLFSAQTLGLSGFRQLADLDSTLPGQLQGPAQPDLPGELSASTDGLPVTLPALDTPRFVNEQPTPGFLPPTAMQREGAVQTTDRTLKQLERTLQAVASNSRIGEQGLRASPTLMPLGDPRMLEGQSGPVPAAVVNVDGNLSDSERYRFRPLGLTPAMEPVIDEGFETSANVARTLTTDAVSRFESIGVLSDGLRTEASLLNKPSAGGFQVHAPSNLQTALPNTASVQAGTSGPMLTDTIQTAVQDQGWGERIGERVAMMANNRLQNAELRLTPAELGPLRVKVSIEDGLANVSFVAQHAVTRDAIEQAMPRLREMLEQQGINLGQSSVDEQASNAAFADGNDGDDGQSTGSSESGGGDTRNPDQPSIATVRRVSNNLLDTFV